LWFNALRFSSQWLNALWLETPWPNTPNSKPSGSASCGFALWLNAKRLKPTA